MQSKEFRAYVSSLPREAQNDRSVIVPLISKLIAENYNFSIAQGDLIAEEAWAEGHSSGWEECLSKAYDLVYFSERLLALQK